MNKQLVIYLGNFGKPETNAAGKRVYGNALIFSSLGYKVVLIGKDNDIVNNNGFLLSEEKNIVFYSFPNCLRYQTNRFVKCVMDVMTQVGTPDYIIRYGSPGLAEFDRRLLAICKREEIKLIADVVDWLPPNGNNLMFNLVKKFDTYLEKAIYNKKSDGIIAISSYLSNYYAQYGNNTIIIPPIVSKYKKNISRNSCIRVVYAGMPFRFGKRVRSVAEVKDRLDLAIRGIASVINRGGAVCFDIYGITKEQYLLAYPDDAYIIEAANAKIKFHGEKSMKVVQEAVNCADYTILLRDQNRATMAGFPTKVAESISCGTPVITTKTSDLEKYILNGKTGFFIDISIEEKIGDDLLRIFNQSRENLLAMKEYCFESKQFCFDNFKDKIRNFIAEL